MRIWIDADGCPRAAKELVFGASRRLNLPVMLVADRQVGRPGSSLVHFVVVKGDMDAADRYIAGHVEPGDLVVTADLPLAESVVAAEAFALNPRGELYDRHNVAERRSIRDFAMSLREGGMDLGGPPPYGKKDRQRFAAALDRFLTRRLRG